MFKILFENLKTQWIGFKGIYRAFKHRKKQAHFDTFDVKNRLIIRKQLKTCDILVWCCFILMLIVKFTTVFLFVLIQEETAADINNIAIAYEGNDLFRIAMSLNKIGFLLSVLIVPASAMAFYYYMKRKVLNGKVDIDTVLFFVQFAFFLLLINIVNDGSALFAKLWKVV